MRTEEYVFEKLKEFNLDISKMGMSRREVALLPTILGDSEELLDLTPGAIGNAVGIIACTDERVILLDKGILFRHNQKDIPLNKINSVTFEKGIMFAKVTIMDASSSIFIEVVNDRVDKLVSTIKNAVSKLEKTNSSNNCDNLITQLEKLDELKAKGILTDEEFNQAKSKLLG